MPSRHYAVTAHPEQSKAAFYTWEISLPKAARLKKSALITPSAISFLQRKTTALISKPSFRIFFISYACLTAKTTALFNI